MSDNWYPVSGNMHVHTRYSDGEAWHVGVAEAAIAAGLDFVIVTDHNVLVKGVEGYYENEDGRVLLLTGEEIHNVRRHPHGSHFLVYGVNRELAGCAPDPQELIDETNAAGGYGFLAHPHERSVPIVDEVDLGWHDWHVDGYTGLEIWNYMSSLKNRLAERLSRLRWKRQLIGWLWALPLGLHPEKYVTGPEPETLALWDQLLAAGKRIAAVGNSDAHATPMRFGPLRREIYPYEFLFRAVNTHLLLNEPLGNDLEQDRQQIVEAIGRGRSWVGYDMAYPTRGFRFTVQADRRGTMGDEMPLGLGATLQIQTPAKCRIRVICHGEVLAEVKAEKNLTFIPGAPGAYRVECTIEHLGRERGWIYSNPIYLRG
jgi:hypothetical protein